MMIKKKKTAVIVLSVLLLLSNGMWFLAYVYAAVDNGVTLTYHQDSFDRQEQAFNELTKITVFNAKYTSKKDLLSLLRQEDKQAMISKEKDHIFYNN